MDSKWKWPALKVARWAFQHGKFFDLYDVSYLLGIPASDAGKVVLREFNFEVRHSPMPPDGTLRIP